MRTFPRIAWPVLGLLIALTALASDSGVTQVRRQAEPFSEYHFVRLAYSDMSGGFGGRERWLTDWPEAEQHLIQGIRRLSRINTNPEGIQMAIMDDKLFDYPWVYAVEVGGWLLSETEAARLRDYLLRGGFLMVDDFHGSYEWEGFVQSMHRVFPDRPIVEIPHADAIFHLAYDLDDHVQIPGTAALSRGVTYEKDGVTPHWRGIYDDRGRLMVVIDFNMDLGDAWEHADNPQYPVHYTVSAYQYAINYVLYAMTH
jgi:hypothetical protein